MSAPGSVQITNESFPASFDKGTTLTVSITVNNAANVNTVTLKSRGLSEAVSALKSTVVTAAGNKYEKVIAAADLTDPIGLLYYFEVQDKQSTPVTISSVLTYGSAKTGSIPVTVANVQPARLRPLGVTNNLKRVELSGTTGRRYAIESLTNLGPSNNWVPLTTNQILTNSVWQFTDPGSTSGPARYYRARQL